MKCLFLIFFVSCKTTEIRVEYKVPEIDFPEFPKLGEYEITTDDKVITDSSFFRKLLTFRTLYYECIKDYNSEKEGVEK